MREAVLANGLLDRRYECLNCDTKYATILPEPIGAATAVRRTEGSESRMTGKNERHVVKNPDGGWDVRAPGAARASDNKDTQKEAISRAREIVNNAGGGEVRIHGRDGKIRDSDTVAPGNDPNPPRDKK